MPPCDPFFDYTHALFFLQRAVLILELHPDPHHLRQAGECGSK